MRICLGYTEPDGGSDIATVHTRAVRDGDEWVVNGAKVFTSAAHVSKYVFLLTNTDPAAKRHNGLTMFVVPLDLPGIEIQPLMAINGDRLNITYLTDVRVADQYRLGEPNEGWSVLQDPLNTEHSGDEIDPGALGEVHGQGVLSTMPAAVLIARALRWASARTSRGTLPIEDPQIASLIADAVVDLEVAKNSPNLMGKVAGSQNFIKLAAALLDIPGPEAFIEQSEPGAVEDGVFEWAHRRAQALAIAGGTVEVFKNIIAQGTLGLPRQLPTGKT